MLIGFIIAGLRKWPGWFTHRTWYRHLPKLFISTGVMLPIGIHAWLDGAVLLVLWLIGDLIVHLNQKAKSTEVKDFVPEWDSFKTHGNMRFFYCYFYIFWYCTAQDERAIVLIYMWTPGRCRPVGRSYQEVSCDIFAILLQKLNNTDSGDCWSLPGICARNGAYSEVNSI